MAIDVHAHAFPDDLAPRAIKTLNEEIEKEAWAVLDGTIADLLRSMDGAGIGKSVVASVATAPKQVDSILEWSKSICGPRIIPFPGVHPRREDPGGDVGRVADAGFRGIKLHPQYQDFTVDDPALWPIYEAIARHGLVLLFHAGRDIAFAPDDDRAAPRRILEVHRAFPSIPIVAAHMGGWMSWDEVARTLLGTDVYLETSYSFDQGCEQELARIVREHPIERVLFGTDSPWREQGETLELVKAAYPQPERQDLVLHGNAERLLGLHGN